MIDIRTAILNTCFERYDGEFASGASANNKLDLENLQRYPELRCRVANAVIGLVSEYAGAADLIVPVPNGANWLGREVAMARGIHCIKLDKDLSTKELSLRQNLHQYCESSKGIVVVEDVINKLTNTRKVLEIPQIGERVVAVVGIWDRGDPAMRPRLGVPVEAAVCEPIPAVLSADASLWSYAA